MNSLRPESSQEMLVVDAPGLRIHVLGLGETGAAVLAKLRKHGAPCPYRSDMEAEAESPQRNEFIFLVADLNTASQADLASLTERLKTDPQALTLNFATFPQVTGVTHEKIHQLARHELTGWIDGTVRIPCDLTGDANSAGQCIFDRIRALVSALSTPGSINVGAADFRQAMTGTRKHACATINAAWGEAQSPDRAVHATAEACAHPSFIKHLNQTDGLILKITGNKKFLMGRDVKQVHGELKRHLPEHCCCPTSICYDQEFPPDVLQVEIFASRWSA